MSLARRHVIDENCRLNDTLNADCECVGVDIQFGTVVNWGQPITLLEAAVLDGIWTAHWRQRTR